MPQCKTTGAKNQNSQKNASQSDFHNVSLIKIIVPHRAGANVICPQCSSTRPK